MADDDNFDIDIYGDEEKQEFVQEPAEQIAQDVQHEKRPHNPSADLTHPDQPPNEPETEPQTEEQDILDFGDDGLDPAAAAQQQAADTSTAVPESQQVSNIQSTAGADASQAEVPKTAPRQQGTRHADGTGDAQPPEPNATAALRLGELQWWVTEDDVRGWANQCGVEDEVKEVSFNEHKINGKSKG